MPISASVFKAYDIRGLYPQEIDEQGAFLIGLAFAKVFQPRRVVVGRDVRDCNAKMQAELIRALVESGVDVVDIGQIPTDMIYFVVGKFGFDGGIVASASHNPVGYGGIKMVEKDSKPVFAEHKMPEIRDLVMSGTLASPGLSGKVEEKDYTSEYFDFILSFIDPEVLKQQKVVANGNFGPSGKLLEKLAKERGLPLEIVPLNLNPDGNFPKGRPDPMVPENRGEFTALAKSSGADFGVSWDADGDRCFFCDGNGNFYEPCYITAFLVEEMLKQYPGAKTLYDIRYVWAVKAAAEEHGGTALPTRVGRSFIMDIMRREDVVFCGESSGHYYFKDNYYSDNGMIPLLLIWQAVSVSGKKLGELLENYTKRFFVSGEFNTTVSDVNAKISQIAARYADGQQDFTDGVSIAYDDWRFNLRGSNTEPLLRCNIEAKSEELVISKKQELLDLLAKND
ncbi:MAG: phosphomannomutase/phosphoglucomutase [Patescibacteria group bacterium]|jgi:phosphomannomutase